MDAEAITSWLKHITAVPGYSGYEERAAACIREAFLSFTDQVETDAFFNVYATMEGDREGPTVLICAHMDEIGMMVSDIDEEGFVRFHQRGVDARILPACPVIIQGKRPIKGVVTCLPPHLLAAGDANQAYDQDEMRIAIGLDQKTAQQIISVGDIITFDAPPVCLMGNRMAGKTLDDRAGVAMLLAAMRELKGRRFAGKVVFCATVQEEIGLKGGALSAWHLQPDWGIAIDVCHGDTPDAPSEDTCSLDKVAVAVGPNLHPTLTKGVLQVAERNHIPVQTEVANSPTGTDANAMQVAGEGIPVALISLPLRYMHTTVETINLDTLLEGGRLLALSVAELSEDWRQWVCF